jgi:hypothetical protein
MSDAQFNEVYSLQVDTAAFEAGLRELQRLYEQFIEGLGDQASGLIGVQLFQGVADQLKTLSEDVKSFQEANQQIADDAALAVQNALARIDQAEENQAERRAARVKQAAEDSIGGGQQPGAGADTSDVGSQSERVAGANREIEASQERQQGFLSGMTGELAESFARLTEIYVMWQAVNAVVSVVTEVIKAPFVAIADGVKFISTLQEEADKLTGVLHGNVQFSANLAENFRQATTAAQQVVLALRDVSTKANIPFDQLERSFSASVDAGIVGTVHNLQEAVKLTELFALALQGAGNSGQALRTLVAQLPLLFEGDVKSTSKLAEALHMSGDELSAMVASAKENRDLLEQLTPKLQPFADAVRQAETHFHNIVAQLQEAKSRLEGIAAGASFEHINALAQELLKWLAQNEDKLIDMATIAGHVASNLLDSAVNAGKIFDAGSLSVLGKAIGQFVVIMSGLLNQAFIIIRLVEDTLGRAVQIATGDGVNALVGIKNDWIAAGAAMVESFKKSGQAFSEIAEGKPEQPAKELAANNEINELKQQLAAAEKARDQALSEGNKKTEVAATNTIELLKQQIAALQSAKSLFADNSALTAPVEDKGGRADLHKDTSGKDAKLDLQKRLADTKSLYADLFEAVKRGEDTLNLTRAQSLAYLEQLGQHEKAAINESFTTYVNALDKTKLGVKGYNEAVVAAATEREKALAAVTKHTSGVEDSTNKKFDTIAASNIKNQYQDQILDAQDFYNKQEAIIKTGEENKSLSKRQGATLLAQAGEQEKALLDLALNNYKQNATNEVHNLNKRNEDIQAAEREHKKLIEGVDKKTDTANQSGVKEGSEVDLAQLRSDLAQRKQALQEDFQFQQQLAAEGKLRQSDLIASKMSLEAASHKQDIDNLNQELSKLSSGTTEYVRVYAAIQSANQKYTADGMLLSAERISALQKEAQAAREHVIAMREAQLGASTEQADIKHTAQDVPTVNPVPLENQQEILRLKEQELLIQLKIAAANGETAAQQGKILEQLAQVNNDKERLLNQQLEQIKSSNNPSTVKNEQSQTLIKSAIKDETADAFNAAIAGDTASLKRHAENIADLNNDLTTYDNSIGRTLTDFQDKFLGFNLEQILTDPTLSASTKFIASLDAMGDAMKSFSTIFTQIEQGTKNGGIFGAIGAGASAVGQYIPGPIGEAVSGIGSVLSFIGSIFEQEAQTTAQNIQKATQNIMEAYQTGAQSLQLTITQVTAERDQAVQQLSNEKGGQGLLDQILPGLNDQILSLKAQQLQITTQFQTQLSNLNLQSDALSGIAQQWQQIVQSVAQYIGAGGDAATAQQYLQQQLEQISKNTNDQLRTANDTAVQDAINLNSLLLQRNQLELSYAQQQFSIETSDSIQRRQSIVGAAEQMAALNAQHTQDMADIDSQIDLATQKVAMESKVFSIATDINTLHQQDNALQLAGLAEQLSEYQKMQTIVEDIANGTSLGTVFASGLTAEQIGTLTSTLQQLIDVIQQNTTQQQKSTGTGSTGSSAPSPTAHAVTPGTSVPVSTSELDPTASAALTTAFTNALTTALSTGFTSTLNPTLLSLNSTLLRMGSYNKEPTVTVNVGGLNVGAPPGTDPTTFGKAVANSLSSELQRRVRQGGR